jgi:hypothetical protein
MAGRVIRRWSDLSERDRRLLIAAAAVEGALKAAALAGGWLGGRELVRGRATCLLRIRPSAQLRGGARLIARALHRTPREQLPSGHGLA